MNNMPKSRYQVVKINNSENISKDNSNIIFMPYTLVERTEPDPEYDQFMKEYHMKHAVCPECGSDSHRTTLMGYVLNMDKKDEYKDLNRCTCQKCDHTGTTHDRISIEEFNAKQK